MPYQRRDMIAPSDRRRVMREVIGPGPAFPSPAGAPQDGVKSVSTIPHDALLTVEQAAAELGCPLRPWRIYELLAAGDLSFARRIGRRWYLPRRAFRRWLCLDDTVEAPTGGSAM